MAKNRNKKKNATAMDVSTSGNSVMDSSQAMDTSDTVTPRPSVATNLRKMKKGRPMKRSKNMSKRKAIAKAISLTEKSEEKISKNESKSQRTKSAKNLYD